ncbi:MAG TPA: tetratricopeptide repeat protein, partial [Spirochaetota bacterium]|nr:tetratricopeptide repeat protein [Spirochaetota bacterium]
EEYKPARQDFMSVLQLDPENSSARDYIEKIDDKLNERKRYEQRLREAENFYASGKKNIRDNKYDEARDDFENALALIENFRDARQLLMGLPGLKAEYDRREREKRLRMIDEQFQNGLIALADSRYQDAIAAFENTLKLDPENKLAPSYIQRAKDAQKLVEEEIVDENSPYFNVVNSLIVSGKTLYDSGRYNESKNRWEQILQLFPSNRIANEYMFKCELKLKPEQREIMVKKFIEEGEAFLKKREYRNAYRRFDLVRSIEPNYPDIKNLLARAERGQSYSGSTAVAQEDIQEIERRFNLGMAYYQRGGEDNIKKALVELRWVASKDPNNIKAVVSVNKIEAQLRVGTSSAKTGGSRLSPEQERLVRKYYYSGINYYSNNDFKRAIGEWRKVLAIDPEHTRAKNNIRKTLVLLGR